MAERLITPLIPPPGREAGRGGHRGRPVPVPLPLAARPDAPAPLEDTVYGMGRVDASGRVSDRTVMRALGWQAGDRLTVTAAGGVVIAHRDPAGLLGVTGSACLTIPAALRRRCGLEPGVRVLLTAAPARQVLAACSLAVVDEAIRAKVPALAADGGAP